MKHLMFVLFLLSSQFQLTAQTETSTVFTNMEAAKEYATTHNTNILMVFAGSDWCKPCIQFKKEILETTEFKNWSSDRLVILYLDFPARRKNKLSDEQTAHNEALAERFNKSGIFPNILLIDTDEIVLANPAFKNQSTEAFAAELQGALTSK